MKRAARPGLFRMVQDTAGTFVYESNWLRVFRS